MSLSIQTVNKIKSVAEFAHYAIGTGSSLKASKEHITSHTKIFAGYEHQWHGVDHAEVLEAFEQAMDCSRKADFTRRLELLIETMINIEIEIEREQARAATPAAPAAATPVISEAEAMQVTFWGSNDYAARRAIVEAAHAEALEWDRATDSAWMGHAAQGHFELLTTDEQRRKAITAAHAAALPMDARHDARTACQAQERKHHRDAIEAAHIEAIEADKARTAHRLWGAYLNEDFAGRRRMVEAAHADALARDRVYDVMHADFVAPAHRTAPAPAADIDAIDIRTLHEPIEAEADQPYEQKTVTRAYVARSIARALRVTRSITRSTPRKIAYGWQTTTPTTPTETA